MEAIVSDLVRGERLCGRKTVDACEKEGDRKRTFFFLNGRREAGAGTRREGEKREKQEGESERKRMCGVNRDLGLVRATGSRFPPDS